MFPGPHHHPNYALRRLARLRSHVLLSSHTTAVETKPNPSLLVNTSLNLAGWMLGTENRRAHFHQSFGKQSISMRSASVMTLTDAPDARIANLQSVMKACDNKYFSGMVVLQGSNVLFERYAADFGADSPHSMQSVTKTVVNLLIGRLIEEGKLHLDMPIASILPEIGSGYAASSLERVLDMTVRNNFVEDYKGNAYSYAGNDSDSNTDKNSNNHTNNHNNHTNNNNNNTPPQAAQAAQAAVSLRPVHPMGYSRQEVAMGWRLPPPGESSVGMRPYIAQIQTTASTTANSTSSGAGAGTGTVAESGAGTSVSDLDSAETVQTRDTFHQNLHTETENENENKNQNQSHERIRKKQNSQNRNRNAHEHAHEHAHEYEHTYAHEEPAHEHEPSHTDTAGYKSPNNDVLAWVAERASGTHIRVLLQEVVEAAGISGQMQVSCDTDFVPVTSGGGFMTARDMGRYGQIFARLGVGVSGQNVGSRDFINATRTRPEHVPKSDRVWYHNQMQSNGQWVGHGGFGGQWLAAHPETGMSIAFFSVFGDDGGIDGGLLTTMTTEISDLLYIAS